MNRDAISAELLEIESTLQDDRLNDNDLATGLADVLPHRQATLRSRLIAFALRPEAALPAPA
jgi:hypothetical protein